MKELYLYNMVVALDQCFKLVQRCHRYYQYCERRPYFLTFSEERPNTMSLIYCYFLWEDLYFSQKFQNFASFYQSFPIHNDSNIVKVTS
jgi:hypothetical protein